MEPRYANYPGDQRHIVGELKGPSLNGRLWVATGATYNPDTNRTRVEFGWFVPEGS